MNEHVLKITQEAASCGYLGEEGQSELVLNKSEMCLFACPVHPLVYFAMCVLLTQTFSNCGCDRFSSESNSCLNCLHL